MAEDKETPVEVLIIGSGPTGLALALELAVQKVTFRIIEKAAVRSDKSRALVIQPRSLELLNRHGGISHKLAARGTTGVGTRLFVRGRHSTDITFDDLGFNDTAFPLPLWLSQVETETVLEDHLSEQGFHVERGIAADKIVETDDGVSVTVSASDGAKSTLQAKYVVGCDGAHSLVRHAAGLTFEGAPYAQQFLLCDAQMTGDYARNRISFFLGQRVMVLFPMKDDHVRIVGMRQDADDDTSPKLAEFQRLVDEMAPAGWTVHDPVWLANFRFHRRGVNSYRAGRLFVAGDAAHIHSPAGGQGMNTGIQDAINLGWKLGLVLRGQRDDALLDTYDAERRPVGDHLLNGTDRMFGFMSSSNPFVVFIRNNIVPILLPWAASSASRRAAIFRFVSEFGIRYRRSPIVSTAAEHTGPVRGGDRAPDGKVVNENGEAKFLLELCDPVQYTLVAFAGVKTQSAAGEADGIARMETEIRGLDGLSDVQVVRIGHDDPVKGGWQDADGELHRRYGFASGAGFVLLRPDLYVTYIGSAASLGAFVQWWRSAGT